MTGSNVLTGILPEIPAPPGLDSPDGLAALQALDRSVLKMAEMLRHGFWDATGETGSAGEIHAAITGLHIDAEREAAVRQALEARLSELGENPEPIREAALAELDRHLLSISGQGAATGIGHSPSV